MADITVVKVPLPKGMENLLDPEVIARRVANGERLNAEAEKLYGKRKPKS